MTLKDNVDQNTIAGIMSGDVDLLWNRNFSANEDIRTKSQYQQTLLI